MEKTMLKRSMIIDCSEPCFAARRQNRLPLYCGLVLVGYLSPALADNWEPMTGADTLREFVAGATAEISLTPEVTAVGKYNADGTATIRAWNETFLRSWAVKGDDQVCYSSDTDTNCFRFERNLDDPSAYR